MNHKQTYETKSLSNRIKFCQILKTSNFVKTLKFCSNLQNICLGTGFPKSEMEILKNEKKKDEKREGYWKIFAPVLIILSGIQKLPSSFYYILRRKKTCEEEEKIWGAQQGWKEGIRSLGHFSKKKEPTLFQLKEPTIVRQWCQ